MSKFNFIVDEKDEDLRFDNYLSNIFPHISRSKLQDLIKSNNAQINDAPKKPAYKLKLKDKISIEIPEQTPDLIEPQDIEIEIIYEDENMLVVNKPSGMLTHPTTTEKTDTLVNALMFKYKDNLSDINGDLRRGIIHRLDRNTSGLLMVAKNNKAHEFLAQQIKERTVTKKYLTVVKGVIKDDSGIIDLAISRHPSLPKMAINKEGRASQTEFKVLQRFKDCTFLELNLITGRTHQIRVHLSHLKHPIVNDSLYGGSGLKIKTQEQVLQSYKLSFTKPFGNDKIELEINHDEKIQKVLDYLKNKRG